MKSVLTLLRLLVATAMGCVALAAVYASSDTARALLLTALLCTAAALEISRRRHRLLRAALTTLTPSTAATADLDTTIAAIAVRLAAATRAERHLDSVVNGMAAAVFVVDPAGLILDSNSAATRLLGWTAASLRGRALVSLLTPEDRPRFLLDQAVTESGDYVIETASSSVLPVAITGSRVTDTDEWIFVLHDITERRRAERRVSYLAKHDGLTRVPNRMQFQHLLQQAIARGRREGRSVALFYLDVDRFKDVNDTFGHAAGDRALEILSKRLSGLLPEDAVIGRLAGDEFAAFVPDVGPEPRAAMTALAHALLADTGRAFFLEETEVYLTISIGIALCDASVDNTIELIRCADLAMYHAKQSGGGSYAFYDLAMSTAAVERLVLTSKLRRAIEMDELFALYQPIVDLESGRIVGAEALLRWRLPGHGDIPPAVFIPLAEQSTLIDAIGEWVFRRVCADFCAWRALGSAPERMSINLSLRQFSRSGFVDRIGALLREYNVPPQVIELEITESTLLEYAHSEPIFRALAALGLRLAIDDFGTGYSSFSALRQMPIQTLKIDQSFIRRMVECEADATLVRTIIELGRNLGLQVVGEGVETLAQHDLLALQGCHLGQGLLFGAPMTAQAISERLLVPTIDADAAMAYRFHA